MEQEAILKMSPACEFCATSLGITFVEYYDASIGSKIVRSCPDGGEQYGCEEPVEKENEHIPAAYQLKMAKERCVNSIIRKLNSPPKKESE